MIELRWMTYADTKLKDEHGEEHVAIGVGPTLQFRTHVLHMGSGYQQINGIIHKQERPMGYGWSEWQDVPHVVIPPSAASDEPKEGK